MITTLIPDSSSGLMHSYDVYVLPFGDGIGYGRGSGDGDGCGVEEGAGSGYGFSTGEGLTCGFCSDPSLRIADDPFEAMNTFLT